jgi:hypothetical protein
MLQSQLQIRALGEFDALNVVVAKPIGSSGVGCPSGHGPPTAGLRHAVPLPAEEKRVEITDLSGCAAGGEGRSTRVKLPGVKGSFDC